MVDVELVLGFALAQEGDEYKRDINLDLDDPDPHAFDCAELVEWACHQARVDPTMPDGSWIQAQHCSRNGKLIPVAGALTTRGALLFKFDSDPFKATPPEHRHVAISLGDGRTMEAQGTKAGVGIFRHAERRKWTHAALIPGVSYGTGSAQRLAEHIEDTEEDDVTTLMFFAGPDGRAHPYVVAGVVGKHLSSPEALKLHKGLQTLAAGGDPTKLKTKIVGEEAPLGKEFQDGVALLDGPLRNVP
jgi:hypothetical protein